jgi:hypothetical protein
MGAFLQCFTLEELEELDESQLSLLRNVIEREIRSNADIQKIIRDNLCLKVPLRKGDSRGPALGPYIVQCVGEHPEKD